MTNMEGGRSRSIEMELFCGLWSIFVDCSRSPMCFHILPPLLFFKFLIFLSDCTVSSLAMTLLTVRPLGLAEILAHNGLVVHHY